MGRVSEKLAGSLGWGLELSSRFSGAGDLALHAIGVEMLCNPTYSSESEHVRYPILISFVQLYAHIPDGYGFTNVEPPL